MNNQPVSNLSPAELYAGLTVMAAGIVWAGATLYTKGAREPLFDGIPGFVAPKPECNDEFRQLSGPRNFRVTTQEPYAREGER